MGYALCKSRRQAVSRPFQVGLERDSYRLWVSHIKSGNFSRPLTDISRSNGFKFNAMVQGRINTVNCSERVHLG